MSDGHSPILNLCFLIFLRFDFARHISLLKNCLSDCDSPRCVNPTRLSCMIWPCFESLYPRSQSSHVIRDSSNPCILSNAFLRTMRFDVGSHWTCVKGWLGVLCASWYHVVSTHVALFVGLAMLHPEAMMFGSWKCWKQQVIHCGSRVQSASMKQRNCPVAIFAPRFRAFPMRPGAVEMTVAPCCFAICAVLSEDWLSTTMICAVTWGVFWTRALMLWRHLPMRACSLSAGMMKLRCKGVCWVMGWLPLCDGQVVFVACVFYFDFCFIFCAYFCDYFCDGFYC